MIRLTPAVFAALLLTGRRRLPACHPQTRNTGVDRSATFVSA